MKNTIVEGKTHNWITSDVHYGKDDATKNVYIENNALYVYTSSGYAMALMDMKGKTFDKITKINFDMLKSDSVNRRTYVNLLVNANQEKAYHFCIDDNNGYWGGGSEFTYGNTPYVEKKGNIS